MKKTLVLGAVLVATTTPASAMNVQTFLTKAEALQRKGPLALFSSDLKLLMNTVESDLKMVKAENQAAKTKSFCPPEGKVSVSDKTVLEAMRAVPPAKRASTDSKEAFRAYFARRYPCKS